MVISCINSILIQLLYQHTDQMFYEPVPHGTSSVRSAQLSHWDVALVPPWIFRHTTRHKTVLKSQRVVNHSRLSKNGVPHYSQVLLNE